MNFLSFIFQDLLNPLPSQKFVLHLPLPYTKNEQTNQIQIQNEHIQIQKHQRVPKCREKRAQGKVDHYR
jgi:hypothetical protein